MSGSRNLKDFTVEEVGELLDSLNLSDYKSIFLEKRITGDRLFYVETVDELVDYGIASEEDAEYFFVKINELKNTSGEDMLKMISDMNIYMVN